MLPSLRYSGNRARTARPSSKGAQRTHLHWGGALWCRCVTSPHQSPEHSQHGSESALPTTGRSCAEGRSSRAGSAVVVLSSPLRSRKRSPAVVCPRGRRLRLAAGRATAVSQRSRVGERPPRPGTGGGWLLLLLRAGAAAATSLQASAASSLPQSGAAVRRAGLRTE